ncbi:MAG: hypothetical protein RL385_2417 [Pseudomonadota bacterium]|jgi:NAD(P)-dependent dehydrogenase (short-subunit alcohol dehydrogenase family)
MTSSSERIALITGGSRGLGRNMAIKLAEQGVGVVITYHSCAADAEQVVAEISARGQKALALRLDVGASATFETFAEHLRAELIRVFGRAQLDYLVNNAGVGLSASFAETSEAQFDALMNIHLKGTFFLSQRLLPLIADGGRILNVSTGLARFSFPGYAAYATMKGGVEVLTRYMAKELASRRIAVNVLAPGAIETDFRGGEVRDNPQINAHIAAQTALGRVGLPDDIGQAVAMLLSPAFGWLNGQRIELSGGMML